MKRQPIFSNPFLNGELNWISNIIQRPNETPVKFREGVICNNAQKFNIYQRRIIKIETKWGLLKDFWEL